MIRMMRRWSARGLWLGAALTIGLQSGSGAAAQERETETVVRHGISAFGDLRYPADFEHFDYVYVDAPREGEIRLQSTAAARTFNSFNMFIAYGDPAPNTELLFDSLMVRAYDEPDAVYGLVAESVEMPADRSFAIFRLRPEARFADGSPLTAEDVAWTVETLRDRGSPRVATALQSVEAVVAIDAHTVRFDFAATAGRRDIAAYVAQLPILSRAWFETHDFEEVSLEPPLGSGPYRVGAFDPGDFVEYIRRDDYWAADLPVRRGQFNFSKITFVYFRDRNVGLEAFFSGSFDFHEEFTSRLWATGYDVPPVEEGWIVRDSLADDTPSGTQGWWMNTRRAKFADPRVREAIALVYNFEQANRQQFYEIYERVRGPFENSAFAAEGEPSPEELALLAEFGDAVPEAALGPALVPPIYNRDELPRAARRRAIQLLEAAGWTIAPGDGVLRNAAGEAFEIEFLDRTGSGFARVVTPYIDNLGLIGIQATYHQVDPTIYEERVRNFEFDMVSARFVFEATLGTQVRTLFHSDSANTPDSYNRAGIASPVLDALILRMEEASTRDDMIVAARAFDRVFRAGYYWTPAWYKAARHVAYWDRFGRPRDVGLPEATYDRGVLLTWWVDQERARRVAPRLGR